MGNGTNNEHFSKIKADCIKISSNLSNFATQFK